MGEKSDGILRTAIHGHLGIREVGVGDGAHYYGLPLRIVFEQLRCIQRAQRVPLACAWVNFETTCSHDPISVRTH